MYTEKLENYIKLDNGKIIFSDYGKYRPNILFILTSPEIKWEECSFRDLNLPEGDLKKVKGNFFKTKKGANAFEINETGKHLLIRDNWGGAFNRYRGGTLEKLNNLYFRRASSNGGGSGYDYVIINLDEKYKPTIDDF